MTRKEKEKILLDGLGLKVGDVVEITYNKEKNEIKQFKIKESDNGYYLENETLLIPRFIEKLIECDFMLIKHKKTKGELKCSSFKDCDNCPLYSLYCDVSTAIVLYEILEKTNEYFKLDPRIYNVYKEILDEEVEE